MSREDEITHGFNESVIERDLYRGWRCELRGGAL
jgi:hypothetical protein